MRLILASLLLSSVAASAQVSAAVASQRPIESASGRPTGAPRVKPTRLPGELPRQAVIDTSFLGLEILINPCWARSLGLLSSHASKADHTNAGRRIPARRFHGPAHQVEVRVYNEGVGVPVCGAKIESARNIRIGNEDTESPRAGCGHTHRIARRRPSASVRAEEPAWDGLEITESPQRQLPPMFFDACGRAPP